MLLFRGGVAAATFLAGMLSGRKRGAASTVVLLGSLGLSLLQGQSVWVALGRILQAPGIMGDLVPHSFTQGLALLTGLRTAWQVRK